MQVGEQGTQGGFIDCRISNYISDTLKKCDLYPCKLPGELKYHDANGQLLEWTCPRHTGELLSTAT